MTAWRCGLTLSTMKRGVSLLRRPGRSIVLSTCSLVAVVAAVAFAAAAPASAAVKTWSLANDFAVAPDHANPNPDGYGNASVWSFRESATLAHAPAGYTLLPNFTSRVGRDRWAAVVARDRGRGSQRQPPDRQLQQPRDLRVPVRDHGAPAYDCRSSVPHPSRGGRLAEPGRGDGDGERRRRGPARRLRRRSELVGGQREHDAGGRCGRRRRQPAVRGRHRRGRAEQRGGRGRRRPLLHGWPGDARGLPLRLDRAGHLDPASARRR